MKKEIDVNKIKFHFISQDDLILALDRLTRFKYPEIKYYRVFSELLCKYLVEPKLSKSEVRDMDVRLLKKIVEKVWNDSAAFHNPDIVIDKNLNQILKNEIFSTYNISSDMEILVSSEININAVLDLIGDTLNAPINLKRLLLIEKNPEDLVFKRRQYSLRFPLEKVVLCEGITEEILLPCFSKLSGYDFDKEGVKLLSAGGKNQVAKLYCELKEELKIPIFILLDADAFETSKRIEAVKRDCDSVYLIQHGEFEDTFSLNLIKRTINKRFRNICECCIADFKNDKPMTKILTDFYRLHELGDFQKADFAKELAENLKYETDLTDEILLIIDKIKDLQK